MSHSSRANAAFAIVDQLAFGTQTFAIAFAGMHWLSLRELGYLTLASTGLILIQVSYRSLALEPLLIRFSIAEDRARRRAVEEASGLSLVAGAVLVTVAAVCTYAAQTPLVLTAAVVAASLMIQDCWRMSLFGSGRYAAAAFNDCLCLLVSLIVLGSLTVRNEVSPSELLLAWAAGTGAGGAFGAAQVGVLPRIQSAMSWVRAHRDLGLPLMGSVLAQQLAGRLSLVAVSAIAGPAALGALSAARTVLTPANTLIMAASAFAIPQAKRRRQRSFAELRAFTRQLSIVLAGATALMTLALVAMPDDAGVFLAGRSWHEAEALLLPTALWVLGTAASEGARIGLRATENGAALLRIATGLGLFMLVISIMGTLVYGVAGAAWGFGLASVAGWLVWVRWFRDPSHDQTRPAVAESAVGGRRRDRELGLD